MIGNLTRDLAVVHGHVATLRADHASMKNEVEVNTRITRRIETNTQDIVRAVENLSALWAFLARWASRFKRWSFFTAKWVGVVAGAFVAVWGAAHAVFEIDLTVWIATHWRGLWR